MDKFAVVILSDPKHNPDESLGRVFNALILANDLKNRGEKVMVFFQGTGCRWVKELQNSEHPAHPLYNSIKGNIEGVSEACSNVFGAAEDIKNSGLRSLNQFAIPGLGGATSLAKYIKEGYHIINF